MMRVLQGRRSQFDGEFVNSGVQCTAIAAVACCKASLKVLSGWDEEDIDDCLKVQKMLSILHELCVVTLIFRR